VSEFGGTAKADNIVVVVVVVVVVNDVIDADTSVSMSISRIIFYYVTLYTQNTRLRSVSGSG